MTRTETDHDVLGRARLSGPRADAWLGFLRSHSVVVKALDADLVARHGLPLSAYEVLRCLALADGGYLRMSDLAQRALLSPSRVSRLVDQLAHEELVQRKACESDSRVVYAVITDRGRGRVRDARATHLQGVGALFLDRLSESDLERLAAIWRRVLASPAPE